MAAKKPKNEDTFSAQTAPPQPPQQTELTVQVPVQIIVNALGIIDMAAQRGAVKGEELFAVGFTRNRLNDAIAPFLTPAQ